MIKPISQYNAMGNYVEELSIGFQELGYDIYIVDSGDEDSAFQLFQLSKTRRIDIVFTFNATFVDNFNVKQLFKGSQFATYLCDHPLYHKDKIEKLDNTCIVFTCDERHERYMKRYYPNMKHVFFVPLSGSYIKEQISYQERRNNVIFTGSYQRPQVVSDRINDKFQGVLLDFALYMKESIISNPYQDLEQCLEDTLSHFHINVPDTEFRELAYEYRDIDQYARTYYRDKIMHTLLESGIKIHVFGNGWENFEGAEKENLQIEKGDAKVALEAVANSRIALNIMPWFKAGFQERIATAMLSGAVSVTDTSSYIEEHFKDGRELVVYNLEKLEELPQKINWLLEYPEEAEKLAERSRICANNTLTWQHRAGDIMYDIQSCF